MFSPYLQRRGTLGDDPCGLPQGLGGLLLANGGYHLEKKGGNAMINWERKGIFDGTGGFSRSEEKGSFVPLLVPLWGRGGI